MRLLLAFKFFIQHLRAGQLNILLLAMVIATSSVFAIGLFTDRLNSAIKRQANQVLAADVQIVGSKPINSDWIQSSNAPRQESFITEFNAMVQFDSQLRMTSIKAVDLNYPLIGSIGISEEAFVESEVVQQGPLPGNIWLSSRLVAALGLNIGDQVTVGEAQFNFEKVLLSAPDETFSVYASDAALLNLQDLERTQVLKPGSRARYKWLIAAEKPVLEQLKQDLTPLLGEHHRWRDVASRNENIDSTLANAENFFQLVAALALILAAIALVMAATRFSKQHTQSVALLKTLGLTPNAILGLFLWQLTFIAVLSVSVGLFLGSLIHEVLFWLLADLLPATIPSASMQPFINAIVTAFVSLFAFAGPNFFALKQVAPIRILRDMAVPLLAIKSKLAVAITALVAILWMLTANLTLTVLFLLASVLLALGLWALAQFLIKLLVLPMARYPNFVALGVKNLARQGLSNGLQMMMFSFALMLLFTLYLVRTSLVNDWQASIPEQTDNYFLFNVFSEEIPAFQQWQQDNEVAEKPLYPMIRGRLQAVNSNSIEQLVEGKARSRDLTREINLTWSQQLPNSNTVTAGQWWQASTSNELDEANSNDALSAETENLSTDILASIEQDWAQELGIQVGDQLFFSVGGLDLTVQVASLREVNWQSLQPNFYVIFDQPIFDGIGASYLTSFLLASRQATSISDLAAR